MKGSNKGEYCLGGRGSQSAHEATRDDVSFMREYFPDFNMGDKVAVHGGGNVQDQERWTLNVYTKRKRGVS